MSWDVIKEIECNPWNSCPGQGQSQCYRIIDSVSCMTGGWQLQLLSFCVWGNVDRRVKWLPQDHIGN